MTRGVRGESPANVQKFLEGISYPASKDDLIATARQNGATEEVMKLIQELPGCQYGGPQEVMKAYGEIR